MKKRLFLSIGIASFIVALTLATLQFGPEKMNPFLHFLYYRLKGELSLSVGKLIFISIQYFFEIAMFTVPIYIALYIVHKRKHPHKKRKKTF